MNCAELKKEYTELLSKKHELDALWGRLEALVNTKGAREEAKEVLTEVRQTSKEIQEKIKILNKELFVSIEKAEEIFGKDFLGPQDAERTFGVRLEEIPRIPFSLKELRRAQELGQMLIYRTDKTADGKPMSLEAMNEIVQKKWDAEGKGKLLYTDNNYENWKERTGADFDKKPPHSGWALVSKDVLPESLHKNYLEQTEVIALALKQKVFKGQKMPEEYAEAIIEFESRKAELAKLMGSNWKKAAKQLANLKITQLTRQTIQEITYDLAMYYDKNNERLLPDIYVWSASLDLGGRFVNLGRFNAEGVSGGRWRPGTRSGHLGVSLSRRK